jgi:Fe-S oxidoreductase
VEIGIKAIKLLNRLGYQVIIPDHEESGRTYLSKGLVRQAKSLANANVRKLKDLITNETPLLGIEPSAILSFRDEYPDLVNNDLKDAAKSLSKNALMIDEFISQQFAAGSLQPVSGIFTKAPRKILLHGHCFQKSLASVAPTIKMLSIPENYSVTEIKSGCCGMAGAFGYEKEHYDVSMKVGELVLFPEVRKAAADMIIAAPGTSCRHQIADGTGRRALHPVEVLFEALA